MTPRSLLLPTLLLSLLTLAYGQIPLGDLLSDARGFLSPGYCGWNPLLHERVPRVIVIFCTGASLGTAGAVMQSHFQNPLASPTILGITSGGTLAVLITFLLGLHHTFSFSIPLAAVVGSLASLFIVYSLSIREGVVTHTRLILTGIALSTLLTAIQGTILYAIRHNWHLTQTISEWQAASTNDRSWLHVQFQLPLTLIGLAICRKYRQELNILSLGDEEAKNLGVEVSAVRWRLFLAISLLVAGSLASVGVITFFGLIIPHLFRLTHGPNNITLIPLCGVGGGALLLALDLFLRIFGIYQISLGNVTALIGGLFFTSLLITLSGKGAECRNS